MLTITLISFKCSEQPKQHLSSSSRQRFYALGSVASIRFSQKCKLPQKGKNSHSRASVDHPHISDRRRPFYLGRSSEKLWSYVFKRTQWQGKEQVNREIKLVPFEAAISTANTRTISDQPYHIGELRVHASAFLEQILFSLSGFLSMIFFPSFTIKSQPKEEL